MVLFIRKEKNMRIYDKSYYYGLGATILMSAAASFSIYKTFKKWDNNYEKRLQNIEYVKQNAPDRYISTLETINKSKAPRIVPEDINALWDSTATKVKDSLAIAIKKVKP